MRTIALLCLFGVLFAGCADEAPPAEDGTAIVDKAEFKFEPTKGGIAGLLVDDRYRPIDLDATGGTGEFSATGFVLIQENGRQLGTTENGEFQAIDLDPGTYTLRVQSDKHETTPVKVVVRVGEFTEITLLARRISSESSVVLTTEYSIFAFCAANALLPLTDACNLLDLSGDSGRIFLHIDYTQFNGTLTALVTEFLANQDGDYYILMGTGLDSLSANYYLNEYVNGRYTKCVNLVDELAEECLDTNLGNPFSVATPIDYLLYINGMYDDEINNVLFGLPLTGVGASLAIKGKFMLSAFLGEPEEDLETYCVICPS